MAKKVGAHKAHVPVIASTVLKAITHNPGPLAKVSRTRTKHHTPADYQVVNAVTGHYIKRSASTGRLQVKKDGSPFANVQVEDLNPQAVPNPAIDTETANWAEDAVISYLNKHSAN